MSEMRVEVVQRDRPSPTALPPELVDHFKAQGLRLNLTYADPTNAAMTRGYGRYAVLYDELPATLQKVCRGVFDNPQRHFGELRRGDCVLVAQSFEEKEAWDATFEMRRLAQEGITPEQYTHQIESMVNEEAGVRGKRESEFVRLTPDKLGTIDSHVEGGPDLAKKIQQELAAGGFPPGGRKR